MNSRALDVYVELHRLGLDPILVDERLITRGRIPQAMVEKIVVCKEKLYALIREIDDLDPGVCCNCGLSVQDRIRTINGKLCLYCIDDLLEIMSK